MPTLTNFFFLISLLDSCVLNPVWFVVTLVCCVLILNCAVAMFQNSKGQTSKLQQQPSISITPLPRQPSGTPPAAHSTGMPAGSNKPGDPSGGKATYVICEICDGYIKVWFNYTSLFFYFFFSNEIVTDLIALFIICCRIWSS